MFQVASYSILMVSCQSETSIFCWLGANIPLGLFFVELKSWKCLWEWLPQSWWNVGDPHHLSLWRCHTSWWISTWLRRHTREVPYSERFLKVIDLWVCAWKTSLRLHWLTKIHMELLWGPIFQMTYCTVLYAVTFYNCDFLTSIKRLKRDKRGCFHT